MKIKIYADGSDLKSIKGMMNNKICSGFTTNPSLMRQAGIKDYVDFSIKASSLVFPKPISIECISDDLSEIYNQSIFLSKLNRNVFVKIPIVNSKGKSTLSVIKKLYCQKIKINVTAIMTKAQIIKIVKNLDIKFKTDIILSIFAGRIADTGRDPVHHMMEIVKIVKNSKNKNIKTLWASPREVLNVYQADKLGVDIITIPYSLFDKLSLKNKNLNKYSIETSKMFYNDALVSKYKI